MINHYLSFDVEDVFQSFKERGYSGWEPDIKGEKERILYILELLDKLNFKATFFVLTDVLNNYKDEVLEIKSRGHEIASHGHNHIRLYKRTKKEFQYDIKKSKTLLEDLIACQVNGYRAPGFSLNKSTIWASEIIIKSGFKYSSSTNFVDSNLSLNLRQPSDPQDGTRLLEFPATSIRIFRKSLRICGGFYFRLLPIQITEILFNINEKRGKPINFYLHPFELEQYPTKVSAPMYIRFVRYHNLSRTKQKMNVLLKNHSFTSFDLFLKEQKFENL
jgi:polysaccharide deacetylase family protein (PEP-CTERM system associated)